MSLREVERILGKADDVYEGDGIVAYTYENEYYLGIKGMIYIYSYENKDQNNDNEFDTMSWSVSVSEEQVNNYHERILKHLIKKYGKCDYESDGFCIWHISDDISINLGKGDEYVIISYHGY